MPRRVAGGTAIITAATIIRSTTITATTITPGTTITTVTATGIANPGYSPALRARAHTSLLRTYAPPRVRLGLSPGDFRGAPHRAARRKRVRSIRIRGRLRCRGCGRKGRAVVSIRWGAGYVSRRSLAPRQGQMPGQEKERRRVGGSSRRRSPLGLVRPDRGRQAR